jgi:subtilisin-like proprotein convertase family protein
MRGSMMRFLLGLAVFSTAGIVAPGISQAAVPGTVQVEGALTSLTGTAVTDGTYIMKFGIYADPQGGVPLWLEGPVDVTVKGGGFNLKLGNTIPLSPLLLAGVQGGWLGVQVGQDPELPRRQLGSVFHALRAGVAEGLACTGCVTEAMLDPGALKAYAKSLDLAKVATSGSYADLTGAPDLSQYAKKGELANVALTGKYADLSGVPVQVKVGTQCGTGLVVGGIAADGTLQCVAAMDPAALPANGLAAISNQLLSNEFQDVYTSQAVPLQIPDNNPVGISDFLTLPDAGTAESLSVHVELSNSDLGSVKVVLFDPAGTPYVLFDKGSKGIGLTGTWPSPDKVVSGDLGAWVGKNPKGKWALQVIDTGFLNNAKDGAITAWNIQVKTLSSKKVQANGMIVAGGGVQLQNAAQDPVTCDAAHTGFIYYNTTFQALTVCNGTGFFPLIVAPTGTQQNPATSCSKIPGGKSGKYWLDVDGTGSALPIEVWCDFTTDGGGYAWAKVDDAALAANQDDYAGKCAKYGMEIVVPRTKNHAAALLQQLGEPPPVVNVFPNSNGATGLNNWHGLCKGQSCGFFISSSNNANCQGNEPNGDNNTAYRLYLVGKGVCEFGAWNDGNNTMQYTGSVVCSPNDK